MVRSFNDLAEKLTEILFKPRYHILYNKSSKAHKQSIKNVYHPSDLTTREPQNQQCRNINTNLQRLNGGWTMHSLSLVPPSTLRPPPLSMKNYLKRPWDIVGTLLAPLVQHAHVWNIRLKRHTRIPFRHQVSGTHETRWHGIMGTTWGTGVVHSNFYKTLHMP